VELFHRCAARELDVELMLNEKPLWPVAGEVRSAGQAQDELQERLV